MAIICTNNLTGNDTTGNGSPSTPYKTVNKALSVAGPTDTIKVAGGQWTLVGSVTCTNRSVTISTPFDYTGQLSVGTPIAIDTSSVDGFTKEKTMFTITAITTSTITVSNQAFPTASGTYNLYKLDQIHYSQTATSGVLETLTMPPSYSQILISGGWDSTFTVQDGFTVAKSGTTGSGTGSAALFGLGTANVNGFITFDKFLCANIGFATATSGSIAIDTIVFVNTGSIVIFPTSNFGIWNPPAGFMTLISNNATLNTAWNGGSNSPTTLNLKQWISCSVTGSQYAKTGYSLNSGLSTGPTVKSLEIHWRSAGSAANTSTFSPFTFTVNTGDVFVDYIKFYLSGSTVTPLISNVGQLENAWRYVGNIDTVITDGTVCGIFAGPATSIDSNSPTYGSILNINRTSGSLLDLKWCSFGQRSTAQQFPKLGITQIYGKDTNGNVVVNEDNIPKYADTSTFVTGSNSLKMKIVPNITSTWWNSYICGTLAKPSSSFTLTIKAKASKTVTVDSTRLQYGNAESAEIALAGITLTTSWQDFTFSINPASYPNWNLADDGLMSVFLRIVSSQTSISTDDYIWIDSVTVS